MNLIMRGIYLISIASLTVLYCTSTTFGADKDWLMINNEVGGLGFGERSEATESNSSYVVGLRALEIGYGFAKLGGIGCGVMLCEMLADFEDFPSRGYPSSLLPVYLYVPIINKSQEVDQAGYYSSSTSTLDMRRLLYLECGGSLWSGHGNYARVGIAYQSGIIAGPGFPSVVSWSVRGGIVKMADSDLSVSTGRYVYVSLIAGGIFER